MNNGYASIDGGAGSLVDGHSRLGGRSGGLGEKIIDELWERIDGEIQPDSYYQASGNQIDIITLELNWPLEETRIRFDGIVVELFI